MANPPLPRELALDSNLLFDLAAGEDFALSLLEACQERGLRFQVPPTVVQELAYKATNIHEHPEVRTLARKALQGMRGWGITPFDLKSVGHGITEEFAKCLINRRLLPPEEVNDGLILAEVALAGIPALVTSDRHLLDISQEDLRAVLDERDLERLEICHPRRLGKLLG